MKSLLDYTYKRKGRKEEVMDTFYTKKETNNRSLKNALDEIT